MRAIKILNCCLSVALLLILTTGCERRPLVEMNEGGVTVDLEIDWIKFDAPVPEKATLFFYPENGGEPEVVVTEDVHNVSQRLKPGKYRVLVMNDKIEDFECYQFTLSPSFGVSLVDGCEPLPLGMDMMEIDVPTPKVYVDDNGTLVQEDIHVTAPILYPANVLWTGRVIVSVGGFDFVKSVTGTLSGLSSMLDGEGPQVSVNLDKWTIRGGDNAFVANFVTFGLPKGHTAKADENTLHLDFELTDETNVNRDVNVGDIIEVDSLNRTLNISITTIVSQITGGYDIEVEPWGEGESNGAPRTRAEVSEAKSVYDNGFKMNVLWNGEEVYRNVMASWNGEGFVTDQDVYWPAASEKRPCMFHALSYAEVPAEPLKKKSTFDYSVARHVEDQQDVLVSSVAATSIPVDGSKQKLTFTHALTKVNFTLNVNDDAVNEGFMWRVLSVAMNVKSQGTYTYDAVKPWAVYGEKTDVQYLKLDETKDLNPGANWAGQNNLMVMPQDAEQVEVIVSWEVYRKVGSNLVKVSQKTATKKFVVDASDWRPGLSKRYSGLRLPSIGEKSGEGGGAGDDVLPGNYDDNNVSSIDYNPVTE